MIPSFVENRRLNQSDAEKIAEAFKKAFDINYALTYSGNNFKIEFQSNNSEQKGGETGSSFDELFGGSSKTSNVDTIQNMIKQAKDQMIKNIIMDNILKE